jgi:hypothetical protein
MNIRDELREEIRQGRRDYQQRSRARENVSSTEVELDRLVAWVEAQDVRLAAETLAAAPIVAPSDGKSIGASTARIAKEIASGRARAHQKHAENSIEGISATDPRWPTILGEEFGEVCHELTYDASGDVRSELVDVATVAVAWIAAIDGSDAA